MFIVVQSFRTSSNYTTGHANTWLGCSTGVRCGSILPNLFELHYWTRQHLIRVFYKCSLWFKPSEPLRTTLLDTLSNLFKLLHSVVSLLLTSSTIYQTVLYVVWLFWTSSIYCTGVLCESSVWFKVSFESLQTWSNHTKHLQDTLYLCCTIVWRGSEESYRQTLG